MSIILLTGATGFLGSHLAHALLSKGHEVKALKRRESSLSRLQDIHHEISWHCVDAREDLRDDIFSDVNFVVHAAGAYGRQGEPFKQLIETNVLFSLKVLDCAIRSGTRSFINAGSCLPRGTDPYALSKAQFTEWGKMSIRRSATQFVNIQLEHMYGPGDDETKFVDRIVDSCLRNESEIKLTSGSQQRDFIYISDVVDAFLTLLENPVQGESSYVDLPLGSGETIAIRELVELIHQLTDSKARLGFGEVALREEEVLFSRADITAFNKMGWKPRVSLVEGLTRTIEGKKR